MEWASADVNHKIGIAIDLAMCLDPYRAQAFVGRLFWVVSAILTA
jgi:hypothetical protein